MARCLLHGGSKQVLKQVAAYVKEMSIQLHNTYSQVHLVGQAQKLIVCL